MDCKCPAIIIYELFTLGDLVLFVLPSRARACSCYSRNEARGLGTRWPPNRNCEARAIGISMAPTGLVLFLLSRLPDFPASCRFPPIASPCDLHRS